MKKQTTHDIEKVQHGRIWRFFFNEGDIPGTKDVLKIVLFIMLMIILFIKGMEVIFR